MPQSVIMTARETACFNVIFLWRRRYLAKTLGDAFTPALPTSLKASELSPFKRALFYVAALCLSPLWVLYFVFRALVMLAIYPFQWLMSHIKGRPARGPGERNIQGVYHAFSPCMHMDMAAKMACINDWVDILYRDSFNPRPGRLEDFLGEELCEIIQDSARQREFPEGFVLREFTFGRERLSTHLGNYK